MSASEKSAAKKPARTTRKKKAPVPAPPPTAELEARMLMALIEQKEKYERVLGTLDELDHKAEHAYTTIIKTIIEISRKSTAAGRDESNDRPDPESLRIAAERILAEEYGIGRKEKGGP